MNAKKGLNLADTVSLRPCYPKDSDFYFNVKKTTLKMYVEQIWGVWDDDFQRERHNKNFSPNHTQIIQFRGNDIGILAIEEDKESVMLHNIEILPEYQNKGIGTYLLRDIIQKCKGKGKNIALQVLITNPKARKLYEHLGFRIESETDTHFRMKLPLEH